MTLASMHPISSFKFQSTSAITFHPILSGKFTFTYSCVCRAEVAANAESKLHGRNCRSYWNLEVSARVPRLESNYVSICKLQPCLLCQAVFGEAFTMKRGNFAQHIFVKCPKINK